MPIVMAIAAASKLFLVFMMSCPFDDVGLQGSDPTRQQPGKPGSRPATVIERLPCQVPLQAHNKLKNKIFFAERRKQCLPANAQPVSLLEQPVAPYRERNLLVT